MSRMVASSADQHDEDLPAFVGRADGRDLDARRGRGQRPVVAIEICGVRQPARGADVIAEDVLGRRHAVRERQVVHQGAGELRGGRPLLHQGGEVRVLGWNLGALRRGGRDEQADDEGRGEAGATQGRKGSHGAGILRATKRAL